MPEGQLPVLLPPERDCGHAVDNDNHGSHQEKHLEMKIILTRSERSEILAIVGSKILEFVAE